MDIERERHAVVAVALWRKLINLVAPAGNERPSLAHVTTLVRTGGAGDTTYRPIEMTLIEWSDELGSEIDVTIALTLGDDNPLVRVTSGPDCGKATITVGTHPGTMEEQKNDVARLCDTVELIHNDRYRIDSQRRDEYMRELIDRAWPEWMYHDVWYDVMRRIPAPYIPENAPTTPRFRGDPRPRADIIRDVYMSGPVEWCAETAVSVVNMRHDDCVAYVLSVVYGITAGPARD